MQKIFKNFESIKSPELFNRMVEELEPKHLALFANYFQEFNNPKEKLSENNYVMRAMAFTDIFDNTKISKKLLNSKIIELPNVKATRVSNHKYGTCEKLEDLFEHILNIGYNNLAYREGAGTFINSSNHNLIFVKAIGETTGIALQTIKNKNTYPLIVGGSYGVEKEVADAAYKAYLEQGPWAKIEVDELVLKPIRMVFNYSEVKDIKKKEVCFQQKVYHKARILEDNLSNFFIKFAKQYKPFIRGK